jgi:DNA-binding NtrC family response regulator
MQPRVLIVDDEDMVRENLQAYLEDDGMKVVAVESGEEAIGRIQQNGCCFAVCIMDMRLPGIDGNISIRHIHQLCPSMHFIIHTGSSDYTLPTELQNLGLNKAQVYLKPLLDMAPLAETIRVLTKLQH